MKITIIYDNETSREDLKADWGFACLVEADGKNILFDTGAKGTILLDNMKKLGIEPSSVSDVFISHAHWDHTGGLVDFLKENSNVRLYIPSSYSIPSDSAREVIVVKEPIKICEGVFSTGGLQGSEQVPYGDEIEQSLVVSTDRGQVVISGCSHPGVKNILEAASTYGKIHALIGGLHDFNEFKLLEGMPVICATHCTKFKKEIESLYPDEYIEGGAGRIINI
ncbi:MAG: MBL fold metallo-hydrolase [Deltaproteobacteria bacterium]|nr:MBL fold metallo-hydrolase [Deltaproteobacteria bacterium]MBW2595039.1 MBL fold metallo-hydrolase [Deltaproteobacteria bacterium]MBW2649967.1 MBL fold metallo-hydrolase [Deltaproteobacteria bacterium]